RSPCASGSPIEAARASVSWWTMPSTRSRPGSTGYRQRLRKNLLANCRAGRSARRQRGITRETGWGRDRSRPTARQDPQADSAVTGTAALVLPRSAGVFDEMGYLNLRPEQTNIFFKL